MDRTRHALALVTGASSGIGRAYAVRLAAEGYDLIVVARRGDRLDELKDRLERDHDIVVTPLVADLATDDGMQLVERAAEDPRLEFLVDNAALAHYMPFVDLPRERAEELVKLNVLAPVRLIRAALPGMVSRGHGTVVSLSSLLAFGATAENPRLPQRAVYASTKAFLLMFIRLLAEEHRDSGLRFQVVCPGVVKTEFHTRQGMDMSHMPRLEAEQVVEASFAGLARGEVVCIPTLDDFEKLGRHDQAEREVFAAGLQRQELAARYR